MQSGVGALTTRSLPQHNASTSTPRKGDESFAQNCVVGRCTIHPHDYRAETICRASLIASMNHRPRSDFEK